ncbi:MAG: HAMP domain-containing protein [wastewater metagenome]|nr:HAMP domain-containing protein [Candidatus Loosdrechtia aerotolerans]
MKSHKIKSFLSIKGKLLIFAFCISLIPIITITTLYYFSARSNLEREILEKLKAVAESKRLHIRSLMEAGATRVKNFSSDGYIRKRFELITREKTPRRRTVEHLNRYLSKNKKELYEHIDEIILLDKHGYVISSTNENLMDTNMSSLAVFQHGIKGKYADTFIGEAHYSPHIGANCILISAPVVSRQGELIGIIINAYNLAFLNDVTTDSTGMGKTGEVYLVNRDKVMLTESRFIENAPLKEIVDTEPIRTIIQRGKDTVGIYNNYNGVPVVGVSLNIPEYGWILSSEIGKSEAFAPLRLLGMVALILGVMGIVTVTSVGLIFAISTSRPIRTLTDATQRLAGGELDHRVKINRTDEIGDLALNFNTMADELRREIYEHRRTEKALIELNENLQQEVTARKRIEGELRRQHDHLEQVTVQLTATNKELEAFCYSVSHDLRSPLRSMDGFSRAILDDYADKLDATGKNYLERICSASQRMGQLIDDLLDLSRITRVEMNKKAVNLSTLARTIVTELREKQPERKAEFSITDGLAVKGDPQLLKIVLDNLFDNAWKFTKKCPQAKIEFSSTQYNGKPTFFIRDNGVGFDMAYFDKLFNAFQRLHSALEYEGTGIGLATVQRIIHRHGGNIWAESTVGKGATFYFTLS